MAEIKGLEAGELYRGCDPESLPFETTGELEDVEGVIGQPRAVEAVSFGLGMPHRGYNLYALGSTGVGKHSLVRDFAEKRADQDPVPSDWVYVNNFEDSRKPRTMRLPAGTGAKLRDDMSRVIEELRTSLTGAFEGEDYQERRQAIEEEANEQSNQEFSDLRSRAQEKGLTMMQTPMGWVFAPVREGEVISPDEFNKLEDEERERVEADIEELQQELQRVMRQMPRREREKQKRVRELNQEVADFAAGGLLDELRREHESLEEVLEYIDEVQSDLVEHAQEIVSSQEGQQQGQQQGGPSSPLAPTAARRYQVNVVVDNSGADRAPVVYEDNPTYQNLLGSVEYTSQMGALITDFNLIRAGALHRANGGYLILDVRKLLMQPFAWEGLKRALSSGQLRVESPGQAYGMVNMLSLEPEPVSMNVKVILLGDRMLYYLLSSADPEFGQLFKVAADFDEEMDRDGDNQLLYARLIGGMARQEGMKPFHRGAVARIIEHSSRMRSDAEKLSAHLQNLADVLRESDYWASENGNGTVGADDVERAIEAAIYRSDRMREKLQEQIQRDTLLIDTEGEEEGQINGLSVIGLGGFTFGSPSRITARIRMGRGQLIDIEREVKLGGAIHSKGVMILSGFLGARYAAERPLSLSASLVFEQTYGGVEGDSASSAELYALLSAISGLPIKQSLAVTGSINQHGEVQPIGGVNEKIEGFFDVCNSRGLTGEQGVLIPASNVKHLMLRKDVVDAVGRGEFHVYPVRDVDEGIELLTGVSAGEQDEEGNYPEESVNGRVERRLQELTEKQKQAASRRNSEENGDNEPRDEQGE